MKEEMVDHLCKMAEAGLVEATPRIVRCKDCKYWVVDYPDGEEFWSCDKWQGWAIGDYFTENDYCSRGEKKDD